jgi:hypothetical protein
MKRRSEEPKYTFKTRHVNSGAIHYNRWTIRTVNRHRIHPGSDTLEMSGSLYILEK